MTTYSIPNSTGVVSIDLAEPDSGDFRALGYHRTGVVSGGAVTQSGSPSMTVLVEAAEIVIDGVPYAKSAGPVVLDPSTASPRFDIIGWNIIGGPVAIKGTPNATNPTFPTFDPMIFCMTAIVLVGGGASSITTQWIVQKQVGAPSSLRRNYANDSDPVLEFATPTKTNSFKALANGTLSWVSSVLSRTADTALQWATSLTIVQNLATDKALILKAAAGVVKGDNILEVHPSGSSVPVAAIDAVGRLSASNFRIGSGSPEGVVTADRMSLYLNDTAVDGNSALWVKLSDAVSTGWVALASYVPASQAIPVGCVLMWPGTVGVDTVPVGYLYCDGAEESSTTYPALSTFCGTKFGSATAGNFRKPDYRGKTMFGVDGVLATVPGVNIGASEIVLSVDQLTTHIHEVTDDTHAHPQGGPYIYQVPQAYTPPYHLPYNDGTGVGIDLEPTGFDHNTTTPQTATETGGSQPISLYQPSQSTNYVIKT